MTALFNLLKKLVSKIPFHKVGEFLKFAWDFAAAAAKKGAAALKKITDFVKKNPGKIVDWFLKGYSLYEMFKMILG
ncbi:AMEP412 family response elicitor [Bacillus kwashiorkori]|uniref:AMEP412 family response elicitor n=1 Tax=Bacillus kwashiorkori TaxID=1522318 RepID=UPI000780DA71|nr:AMEP412 family response elicitor [Bacillus kwashiorkori]